jgi:SAM-dependent methyltransferase
VSAEGRAQAAFSEIYAENVWGKGSGVGSAPEHTVEYAELLHSFMDERRVSSIVDFGCGDWQFSKDIDWGGRSYLGVDVVEEVVEANTSEYASDNVRFELMRNVRRLPKADLLVSKDVLQHLPNKVIKKYLKTFKSKYKYLLITNDILYEGPHGTSEEANADIDFGQWHAIRLDQPPFDEQAETLLEWSVRQEGHHWIKRTSLLQGR